MVLTRSQVATNTQHKYETRLQTNREEMRQTYLKMMEKNEEQISKKVCKTPCFPIQHTLRRSQRIKIML